mmetsp:Transcript_5833/g.13796  ORF Transcript_5833/g.13796 Transcript_5833/m.13796 type:complete len:126 (+) Transcript_5833:2051-2428(+)
MASRRRSRRPLRSAANSLICARALLTFTRDGDDVRKFDEKGGTGRDDVRSGGPPGGGVGSGFAWAEGELSVILAGLGTSPILADHITIVWCLLPPPRSDRGGGVGWNGESNETPPFDTRSFFASL